MQNTFLSADFADLKDERRKNCWVLALTAASSITSLFVLNLRSSAKSAVQPLRRFFDLFFNRIAVSLQILIERQMAIVDFEH